MTASMVASSIAFPLTNGTAGPEPTLGDSIRQRVVVRNGK
jgi:hypothetical protein